MREINKQLSSLQQKFGNNILNETNAFQLVIDDEKDLIGLPEAVRTAAAEVAKEAGMENCWLFGLQRPSYGPFMQYSQRRDLREKMFKAYSMRGNNGNENDNKQVILDIMRLRIEKANLLGFDTPANFILDETMAKNSQTVNEFLAKIFTPAVKKAKEECAEMQQIIDREGGDFKLAPWDWDFYAEKLRQEKYALNEAEIKPYFQMENVRAGVFAVAHKLYGLNFEKLDNVPITMLMWKHSKLPMPMVRLLDCSILIFIPSQQTWRSLDEQFPRTTFCKWGRCASHCGERRQFTNRLPTNRRCLHWKKWRQCFTSLGTLCTDCSLNVAMM